MKKDKQYYMMYDQLYHQQVSSKWDYNDVVLTIPLQPTATLADMEWYMVYGAYASPYSELGMDRWHLLVSSYVHRFYTEHGYIPEQLTPEILMMSYGPQQVEPKILDVYRNPLTGEWPRLNAKEHSPGDLFIKVLSPDEEEYYSQIDSDINAYCNTYETYNPSTGECVRMRPVNNGVLYVRMYGYSGVLHNGFYYSADLTE